MSPEDAARLAGQLHAARQEARLAELPADARLPATPEEAYQVQAQIVRLSGEDIRGWKVTALKEEDRAAYGGTQPVAGPLLSGWVFPSPAQVPAEVPLSRFIAPLLECEFAFLLGRDLPPREMPYTLEKIADAVAALIPAFEIADGRVTPNAPGALRLADSMGNGAFIPGLPVTDWRALDRAGPVTLFIDGIKIETGSGARILGDPLKAVQHLANAQPLCAPLRAGHIITTGTATTPVRLERAGRVEADFGAAGRVRLGIA